MIMRVLPSVYVGLSILSVFYNFIILAADEFARIMSMSFCNTFCLIKYWTVCFLSVYMPKYFEIILNVMKDYTFLFEWWLLSSKV